jgi:hypothetical protein
MDTQEYLGFIAILQSARDSIDEALRDIPPGAGVETRLKRAMADLDKAIIAYREKSHASRT